MDNSDRFKELKRVLRASDDEAGDEFARSVVASAAVVVEHIEILRRDPSYQPSTPGRKEAPAGGKAALPVEKPPKEAPVKKAAPPPEPEKAEPEVKRRRFR